jgi:hypothetical protein
MPMPPATRTARTAAFTPRRAGEIACRWKKQIVPSSSQKPTERSPAMTGDEKEKAKSSARK